MRKPTKEILEKFSTENLKRIAHEFFKSDRLNFEFVQDVLSYENIFDVELFYREFLIEKIIDEVSFEELVESGWCFGDEMEDEEEDNNQAYVKVPKELMDKVSALCDVIDAGCDTIGKVAKDIRGEIDKGLDFL